MGQLLVAEWNSNNLPVSWLLFFQLQRKGLYLGRNYQKLLPARSSNDVIYSFQQTEHYATINVEDQMLRKGHGYNGQNTVSIYQICYNVLCTKTYHPYFCGRKTIKQNVKRQRIYDENKVVGFTFWVLIPLGSSPILRQGSLRETYCISRWNDI